MTNINFNDLPCDMKYLIFNINRQESINQSYKNKYNKVINQLNIVNNMYGEGCFNPNNNFTLKLYCIRESKKNP
jgi:hypothetical protein